MDRVLSEECKHEIEFLITVEVCSRDPAWIFADGDTQHLLKSLASALEDDHVATFRCPARERDGEVVDAVLIEVGAHCIGWSRDERGAGLVPEIKDVRERNEDDAESSGVGFTRELALTERNHKRSQIRRKPAELNAVEAIRFETVAREEWNDLAERRREIRRIDHQRAVHVDISRNDQR